VTEENILELLSTAGRLSLRNVGEMLIESSFQRQAPIAVLIKLRLVDAGGAFLRLTKLGEAVVRLIPTSKERALRGLAGGVAGRYRGPKVDAELDDSVGLRQRCLSRAERQAGRVDWGAGINDATGSGMATNLTRCRDLHFHRRRTSGAAD